MPHYRCSACRARRTIDKPESYIRIPGCRGCGRTMTLDGKPPPGSKRSRSSFARWHADRYRPARERGRGTHVCDPRRTGCGGYHHPHRSGSGWCDHNHRITIEMRQERWESGRR